VDCGLDTLCLNSVRELFLVTSRFCSVEQNRSRPRLVVFAAAKTSLRLTKTISARKAVCVLPIYFDSICVGCGSGTPYSNISLVSSSVTSRFCSAEQNRSPPYRSSTPFGDFRKSLKRPCGVAPSEWVPNSYASPRLGIFFC